MLPSTVFSHSFYMIFPFLPKRSNPRFVQWKGLHASVSLRDIPAVAQPAGRATLVGNVKDDMPHEA